MSRTLLIDADIIIYHIASTAEDRFDFGGEVVRTADIEKAKKEIDKYIARLIKHTGSDQAALFLTGTKNFRKTVLETYKANRIDTVRPLLLGQLRDYLQETHPRVFIEDILEGDDLLGIHGTAPHEGERVIWSIDKDLRTVPCLHWDEEDGEVISISQYDADQFFFEQILTGDPTDNYKGCPGVGKVGAKAFLNEPYEWVNNPKVISRGPNKGQVRDNWIKEPLEVHQYADIWKGIVSFYHKAGLTEADAIVQARCARILQHGEYDFKTKKVKLWQPT